MILDCKISVHADSGLVHDSHLYIMRKQTESIWLSLRRFDSGRAGPISELKSAGESRCIQKQGLTRYCPRRCRMRAFQGLALRNTLTKRGMTFSINVYLFSYPCVFHGVNARSHLKIRTSPDDIQSFTYLNGRIKKMLIPILLAPAVMVRQAHASKSLLNQW